MVSRCSCIIVAIIVLLFDGGVTNLECKLRHLGSPHIINLVTSIVLRGRENL
jgi:hypothetical protein